MSRPLAISVAVLALSGCGASDEESPPLDKEACEAPARVVDGRCLAPGEQDNGCPAGTVLQPDDSCRAAGVAAPPSCPAGLMALPGDEACEPVMECPTGTWGDLALEANTQHVDQSYGGGASDGSAEHPWTTIGEALPAAAPGALVAVATGTYAEDVVIAGKPLRLRGVCPDRVDVVGSAQGAAAIIVREGASGSEIGGLALSGVGAGLVVSGAEGVAIDHLWVHDAGNRGIDGESTLGPTSLTVSRALIEGNAGFGIYLEGSQAQLQDVVVRDTAPLATAPAYGHNIHIHHDPSGTPSLVTMRRAVIERGHELGVAVIGADAVLEEIVVRGVLPQVTTQATGRGISAQGSPGSASTGSLQLRNALVEHNHEIGLFVGGTEAQLEGLVVRQTQPQSSDQLFGRGLSIQAGLDGAPASVTMIGSVIEESFGFGALISGSDAHFEGVVVRATAPRAADQKFGRGLSVQSDVTTQRGSNITLLGSLVEQSHDIGVLVASSGATIEGVAIRDTAAAPASPQSGAGLSICIAPNMVAPSIATVRASLIERSHLFGMVVSGSDAQLDGLLITTTAPNGANHFGDGLVVVSEGALASAAIAHSRIEDSHRAAITSFGALVTLADSRLQCQAVDLNGEDHLGFDFALRDDGGNSCGCPADDGPCHLMSVGLEPPDPLTELD